MHIFRKPRLYADAAAATPISPRARRQLVRLLGLYGNPGALHAEGVAARRVLEEARQRIATAIGAHADEIVFTASGTEANNLAIQGVLRAEQQSPLQAEQQPHAPQNSPLRRDIPRSSAESFAPHAITTTIEHASVLEPLRALAREGVRFEELAVNSEGLVFPNAIAEFIRPETRLVSVALVNSEIGTIEPVHEVVRTARRAKHKIYVHTDASQAPLWLTLNVEKLGVDLMTLDAQKVLGPKGIGCLYVRRGTPLWPVLWGGRQERGLRPGTENVALAGAFAEALTEAQRGAERRARNTAAVRDYLWRAIKEALPDALLNGPGLEPHKLYGNVRAANNLNISIPGLEAQMAVVALDSMGIAVSTRSACSIGEEEPSHVIKAIGVPDRLSGTALRITLVPGVSRGDARRIAQALKRTAERYRIL